MNKATRALTSENGELQHKYTAMVVHEYSKSYGNMQGDNMVHTGHTSNNQKYSWKDAMVGMCVYYRCHEDMLNRGFGGYFRRYIPTHSIGGSCP